jgi:hypothetical protein
VTLVEFLAPLKRSSQRNKVLATLFFLRQYEQADVVSVETLRQRMRQARVQGAAGMNISRALHQSGEYVDQMPGAGWRMTPTGETFVRELLDLPEATPQLEHDVGVLARLAAAITDEHVRGYVEEAVTCLRFGAYRAAVVFLWTGAMWTLREKALAKGGPGVTAALRKHQPKAREIQGLEDFGWINDATFLLAAADLRVIDKSQKTLLEQALELRNACGHPTKYRPREKKVSGYIEDVVGIIFAP